MPLDVSPRGGEAPFDGNDAVGSSISYVFVI